MTFPFIKGERQFPALSWYFYYKPGACILCVGPAGKASGDWHELEPANPWLHKAYGVDHGIVCAVSWHIPQIQKKHQLPLAVVHLEIPYNPTSPVLYQ